MQASEQRDGTTAPSAALTPSSEAPGRVRGGKQTEPQSRRALTVDAFATALFVAASVALAVIGAAGEHVRLGLAASLVALYAVFARPVRLPIAAGSFVPSYLVLVPMLVLLPPALAPLLAAMAIAIGVLARWAVGRSRPEAALSAIPGAWSAMGAGLVFTLAAQHAGRLAPAPVLIGAFFAGAAVSMLASALRERLSESVVRSVRLRVVMTAWTIDACIAPLGLLVAYASRREASDLLLLLPLGLVLMVVDHDRQLRLAEPVEPERLGGRQRELVLAAAQRVENALVGRMDANAVANVVLGAALEAIPADSGSLVPGGDLQPATRRGRYAGELRPLLDAAGGAAWANSEPFQVESDGRFALAAPLSLLGRRDGVLALARRTRAFGELERQALEAFVNEVERTAGDGATYEELRVLALTDPLTGIGNRRKLSADLRGQPDSGGSKRNLLLALFDLDGFKAYNDYFGHPAGDEMLTKLAAALVDAVDGDGAAYRLGGDEFCILTTARTPSQLAAAIDALTDHTTPCPIAPSFGSVLIPREAASLERALSLADQRMYQHKRERRREAKSGPGHKLFRIA